MESVNLHELPRKELKQLCNEHNIRTAGVKHDDLVRLLRNKMYPPASEPPRLPKARSQMSTGSPTSSKSPSEVVEKTLRRSISQGQSQRSLIFEDDSSRDNTPERSKRELSPSPALPRKPVLTKSNSSPARRLDFLRKKANTLSALGKQSQERRPQHSDGSSDKSRSNVGAQRPSIKNSSMAVKRPAERPVVKISEAPKNADAYSEAASSPRAFEGDASVTAVDSSDLSSVQSFRSVSEIATDGGHHVMCEDSENDDGRSVSSEPASRFSSQINKLTPRRSTASKLGRGVYSSWDNEQGSDSLDSSVRNNGVHGQDSGLSATYDGKPVIFSYFLDDADSLVGDTDGDLDSFLDACIADPEDVSRADGHQIDFEQFCTPEISRTCNQEDAVIDRGRSLGGEVAVIYNNEAALTADHPEFELGDGLLVDLEAAAPIFEGTGLVHTNAAVLPSTPEGRTEVFNDEISNDSVLIGKPHAVANADIDIAPQISQNHNYSSDYEPAIASVSFSDSGGSAERVEVSEPAPAILNHRVEAVDIPGHPPVSVTFEERENWSGIESSHDLCGSLSPSEQEILGEAPAVLPDPLEERDYESRDLGIECNKVSEEGVADEQSPKSNEDLTELLEIAKEASEHTQAASLPRLLSDGNNHDSSKQEYSRVVVTTAHSDFENADLENSEDGTPVGDAPDHVPEDTQDGESTLSEPDENRSEVKWSFVSALYDDPEDVNNTVDNDGYGLQEHKIAEADGAGNILADDFEPLKHLCDPESETGNHAEQAAIEVERYGAEDKENLETASLSLVGVRQGLDPSLNEVASKSDEHEEVDNILQHGTRGIVLKSDSYPPDMCATGGEASCYVHEQKRTGSYLSLPLDSDPSRLSNVPKESGFELNVSEHNSRSVDKVEAEETVKNDDLLRSSADDVSSANASVSAECERLGSFTLVQETFEGLREENTSETSTEMEEETETWNACEEDLGVSIQASASVEEMESSTRLKEHESRLPSSEDQNGVVLQGDTHSHGLKYRPNLLPDQLEKTSHDDAAATSRPRRIEQILSVGLKVILVIGSITFGILKFRASRLKLPGISGE